MSTITKFQKGNTAELYDGNYTSKEQLGVLQQPLAIMSYNDNDKLQTKILDQAVLKTARNVGTHRQEISRHLLNAADINAGDSTGLDSLKLVKLFEELQGEQANYFVLRSAFAQYELTRLELRIPFNSSPKAAQKLGPREKYNDTEIVYADFLASAEKLVSGHSLPIETTLQALISPKPSLEKNNAWSILHQIEEDLANACVFPNYYRKDGTGTAAFTSTSSVANNETQRIRTPDTDSSDVHSANRTVDELQQFRNKFLITYETYPDIFVINPTTLMAIASNTWTNNNTLFRVDSEGARISTGVIPFPGLVGCTAVVSPFIAEDIIHATSSISNPLSFGIGPELLTSWMDEDIQSEKYTHTQFYAVLNGQKTLDDKKIKRKFGINLELETS